MSKTKKPIEAEDQTTTDTVDAAGADSIAPEAADTVDPGRLRHLIAHVEAGNTSWGREDLLYALTNEQGALIDDDAASRIVVFAMHGIEARGRTGEDALRNWCNAARRALLAMV